MGGDAPQTPRLRVGSARAFCPVPFAPCRPSQTARTPPPNQGQGVWGLLCWRAAAPHLVHPIQRAVAAAFIQIFHLFRRSTNTSVAIGIGRWTAFGRKFVFIKNQQLIFR